MDLFDDFDRTEHRTPLATDTKYGYLNLSARPAAAAVRGLLAELVARYPAAHRDSLVKRIRSVDTNHDSAVFELTVHELLIRSDCEIIAVEPPIEGRTTQPDFLVRASNGIEFIVECVVANSLSDAEVGAEKRLTSALDAISATPSPHHYLTVNVKGSPQEPIRLRDLRRQLAAWIAELPPGDAAKGAAPFRFEQHGLKLRVNVMMPRRHPPAPGDRSVGAISFGLRAARPGDDLRTSLLKKASKYGELGRPYVIAVKDAGHSGERQLMDALLGSPRAAFQPRECGGFDAQFNRAPDGVWTDGRRFRKRGVSAVLWFEGAHSWRPWGRRIRLVRHPGATHPLPPLPLPFPALNPIEGQFVPEEGQDGPGLFGLPTDWPPD